MCVPLSKVTSKSGSLACTRRPAHFSSRENVPQRLMTSSRMSSFTLGSCKGGDEGGWDETRMRRWRMREWGVRRGRMREWGVRRRSNLDCTFSFKEMNGRRSSSVTTFSKSISGKVRLPKIPSTSTVNSSSSHDVNAPPSSEIKPYGGKIEGKGVGRWVKGGGGWSW